MTNSQLADHVEQMAILSHTFTSGLLPTDIRILREAADALRRTEAHVSEPHFLHCHRCGKCVSTGFYPVLTDTPDKGLIVRAWIECPECIDTPRAVPARHARILQALPDPPKERT
jgi:hypothetical protein